MNQYVIELFGTARRLAGVREVELELPEGITLRDVAAALARAVPALVGPVLLPGGQGLVEPYLFNLNGRHFVSDLDLRPLPGDRIVLMVAAAGG